MSHLRVLVKGTESTAYLAIPRYVLRLTGLPPAFLVRHACNGETRL